MSQQEIQSTMRRGISARSVVLVILLVGLGAGAVGYGLNNAFAAANPSQQSTTTTTSSQQWSGLRGAGPPGWDHDGGSSLSFRVFSTVAKGPANGIAIPCSNQLPIPLPLHGSGCPPAITVLRPGPGLSGSTTVTS